MDRETARKRAQIMLAYADGADIEFFNKMTGQWQNANPPYFDSTVDYRIKEIKYRPFKSIKECLTEMFRHSDIGYIRYKSDGKKEPIKVSPINIDYRYEHKYGYEYGCCGYDLAFGMFTFTDGEPFGIKEE